MKNDYRFDDIIKAMLNAVVEIENLADGLTLDEFISDKKTVSATSYSFVRLSAAAKTIILYARVRGENLPAIVSWRKIANISNWLENYRQKISPPIIWQTIKDDLPEIAKGLRELAKDYPNEVLPEKSKVQRLRLITQTDIQLSSYTLELNIVPYLKAITKLQELINEILERNEPNPIVVKSISQNSPITFGITGALEATQLIQENLIVWKRQHAQTMAKLLETEKTMEIEIKRAEILQTRASASKERAETDKIRVEISLQNEQVEKLRLENEKMRTEVKREKFNLAIEILKKLHPNLDEQKRIEYFIKLLPIIDTLALSELELTK
jgi:uncharacterized protein with HEPN domain